MGNNGLPIVVVVVVVSATIEPFTNVEERQIGLFDEILPSDEMKII